MNHQPCRVARGLKSRTARLFIWSHWLFLALGLTAFAGLLASGLRLVGVPEPSEAVFMGSLGVVFGVGLIRAIPMRYKLMSYNSTWPGLDPREIRFWQTVWFTVVILLAMVEHSPKVFWPSAGILWLALRPPYGLTRESIAQQRALKEERERQSPWPQI